MCPLKEAARDAPHLIAVQSKKESFTFAELDRYADTIDLPFFVKEPPSPRWIAQFFAAFRRGKSIFPLNSRLPQEPQITPPESPSLLLYTSGSTAEPKIALLSLSNLIANASSAVAAVGLKPHDQWRLTLPLYHVGGIGIILRCILARATIVLDDSLEITHLSYVPTHLYRATPVYRKLRCLLLGGAPISSYPSHLPVYTTYGLTEMGSMVSVNGEILPNRELRLSSDGEIFVRGPSLFQGYLGQAPQEGWFATKDLGSYRNGKLEILGRKDWLFISGGENIQPEEIEQALSTFPGVVAAAVLPIDDPEFGKRPVAIVQTEVPFSLQQMQTELSKKLPKYKIPIALYLIDQMPLKDNFKLNRFILSQYIQSQLDPNKSGQKKPAYL